MKNLITILLSTFYFFIASGTSVNLHYCHGEVDSISLFDDKGTCCCHNGDEPVDCCSDENYKYEIDSEQISGPTFNFEFKNIGEKTIQNFNPFTINWFSKVEVKKSNSPPLLSFTKTAERILFSVFRL